MTERGSVDYWLVARCGEPTMVVSCPEGEHPREAGVIPYGRRIVGGPYAGWEEADRAAAAEDRLRREGGPNVVLL